MSVPNECEGYGSKTRGLSDWLKRKLIFSVTALMILIKCQ